MAKKDLLDQPTKGSIEKLFRELHVTDVKEYAEMQSLNRQLDELEKKLLDVPEYLELKRRKDEASRAYYDKRNELMKKIGRVRRKYLARGLTPAVRKEIEELVEEVS